MKNLQTLGDWVIIKPIEEKKETKSGIITPDVKKTIVGEGKIISIYKDNTETQLKIDDKILFNKPASDEIEIDDEKLILIKKENVIAIINS